MQAPRRFFGRTRPLLAAATAIATAAIPLSAQDYVLPGRLLRITDGDTVRVQLASGPINVRLHAIDAPELRQPGGRAARDALARRLPVGRELQLDVTDQSDGYGRMVARILSEGEDLNAWMVRAGQAWVYRQYADPAQDADLCRLEHEARRSGRGLWEQPPSRRIAPWEWRRNQRGQARSFTDWSRETPDNCRANLRKTPDRMRPPAGALLIAPSTVASRSDAAPRRSAASSPPGACAIKGNISRSGRIYHLPSSPHYARTTIDESRGERWFCSEHEAREAGWRPPK